MDSSEKPNRQEDYFSWEASYSKLWSVLLEDESDAIDVSINKFNALQQKRLVRNLALIPGLKRGLVRNFLLVIEASKEANENDLYPYRLKWMLGKASKFAKEYFEENPLCQLGIVLTRDGLAEKLCDLTNDYAAVQESLQRPNEGRGEASFQNALELCMSLFGNSPSHIAKEVLVVQFGLSSCDAGSINETCARMKEAKMKVSFISFLGQVFYSENIAKITGGLYDVVLNDDHFVRLLMSHVHPPPMLVGEQKSLGYLIHMGFPAAQAGYGEYMCLCHGRVVKRGYSCPRCSCCVCSIPSDCPVCHLTLISSSHLARSYHHLFPVTAYSALSADDPSPGHCYGCQTKFPPDHPAAAAKHSCPKCRQVYCNVCDLFIHDSLHNCPGCMTVSGKRM